MRNATLVILAGILLSLSACISLTNYSSYLDDGNYDQGLKESMEALKENPSSPDANFHVGRFLLAKEEADKALSYLEKAAVLEPDNADYRFWIGVAHWAMLEFEKERADYIEALKLDPDHFSANLYLGHSYMDQGEWSRALAQYDRVLESYPYEPGALYNRAVALAELGREEESLEALHTFLTRYPQGSLGIRATELLNSLGDYTYRNYIIGLRTVTLHAVSFASGSAVDLAFGSSPSLDVLAAMLKNSPELEMHVVVYVHDDKDLAKKRAQYIQDYLRVAEPGLDKERIHLSWFGQGEEVPFKNGTMVLQESVNFITKVQ